MFSEESISNIRRREAMAISELAGKPAPKEILIDPEELKRCYFEKKPNPSVRAERVRFGTGGHRVQGAASRKRKTRSLKSSASS